MRFRWVTIAALTAMAALVATTQVSGKPTASKAKKPQVSVLHPGAALPALVRQAQAEKGPMTVYTTNLTSTYTTLVAAFQKKYGITVNFVRILPVSSLQGRVEAEVQTNRPGADVVLIGNTPWYGVAAANGILIPPRQAGIPGWPVGKTPPVYPRKFLPKNGTAVVVVFPYGFTYNTRKLSGADVPKTWKDLLKPQYKGRIATQDPRSSSSLIDLWWLVAKKTGIPDFAARLAPQISRYYNSSAETHQAVAAGEADIAVPGFAPTYAALKAQGAPLGFVFPEAMNATDSAPMLIKGAAHPYSARLFTWYLMTPAAQALLETGPQGPGVLGGGGISVWDTKTMPKGYTRVDQSVSARSQGTIYRAFGVG